MIIVKNRNKKGTVGLLASAFMDEDTFLKYKKEYQDNFIKAQRWDIEVVLLGGIEALKVYREYLPCTVCQSVSDFENYVDKLELLR